MGLWILDFDNLSIKLVYNIFFVLIENQSFHKFMQTLLHAKYQHVHIKITKSKRTTVSTLSLQTHTAPKSLLLAEDKLNPND